MTDEQFEKYWQTPSFMWSKAAALRFITALVEVGGVITTTFPHRSGGKVVACEFMVKLPKGQRDKFENLAEIELRIPATAHVNSGPTPARCEREKKE